MHVFSGPFWRTDHYPYGAVDRNPATQQFDTGIHFMLPGPLILDLVGTQISAEEADLLRQPAVGGVILFSRNIVDYRQLCDLTASIRQIRSELLIAVDQEGGRVQRCRKGFTRLPAMQHFGQLAEQQGDKAAAEKARECGWLMATELLLAGIDFSFAPVLDADDCFSQVIGDRAFSVCPARVATLGGAFIEGMHAAGMAATGKHFPGHGSVCADSHLELPIDNRRYDEVVAHDLIPFQRLLNQLDAIMPAHIRFPLVDEAPVGFSAVWLQKILRQELGFDGVIFSDDLSMEGAGAAGGYPHRVAAALSAGCDVVLVCNNRQGALEALEYLNTLDDVSCPRLQRMTGKREGLTESVISRLNSVRASLGLTQEV